MEWMTRFNGWRQAAGAWLHLVLGRGQAVDGLARGQSAIDAIWRTPHFGGNIRPAEDSFLHRFTEGDFPT